MKENNLSEGGGNQSKVSFVSLSNLTHYSSLKSSIENYYNFLNPIYLIYQLNFL